MAGVEPSPQSMTTSCESSTPGSATRKPKFTVPFSSTLETSEATVTCGGTFATVIGSVWVTPAPSLSVTVADTA